MAESDADLVLNAIVGSAGLGPTIVALTEGIDVALANKESLVVGGELVTALAEATGAQLIPIDSEHTALHHLLTGEPPGAVERLVITASGGPFRGRTDLEHVTVEQALKHPTWSMGGKITIDSATLMNKGLELMEAHHLFGTPYDRIDVVVHPQSIVHAMVSLSDGSTKAHLGYPDMRVAIAYALHHPERADLPIPTLDLVGPVARPSRRPDTDTFPCLRLARDAALEGGTAPCVLNAANEVAVHAFLTGKLPFLGIAGGDRADARAGARDARARVRLPVRGRRARRAPWPASSWGRSPRELDPRLPRLRRADHPARGSATSRPRRPSACAWSASRCSSRRCSAACAAARRSTRSGRSRSAAT